jgi:phosphoheptose isomerase/phosphoglycolate phosphatase-like HAD superfamily hydrolase
LDIGLKNSIRDYASGVAGKLACSNFDVLAQIAEKIIGTKETGAAIFLAGNGGSGATASHMANDLVKGCRIFERPGFKAFCLNDSGTIATCLANDFSYEEVFAIELQTYAKKDDILILFSGSGNSPNIIAAAKYALKNGIFVIGFTGRDGGLLKASCDLCCVAPTFCMEELEDMHLLYAHALVSAIREGLRDFWEIEAVNRPPQGFPFKSALFDFDGTVSLIREGWQEIMIPYFTEVLSDIHGAEAEEEIKACVRDFVDLLTGKQTIFQCIRLDEEVQKRGGPKREPVLYKNEYLRRLMLRIKDRREGLANGSIDPDTYRVPGCVDLFEALRSKGVKLYLASGTDEPQVIEEARLLRLDGYFDGGIFGAADADTDCSKERVIKRILSENRLSGSQLLSFGDGYVEIGLVKAAGGYSVAAATDERRKKGVNEWKRDRLLKAGADAVVPDFSRAGKLIKFLEGLS